MSTSSSKQLVTISNALRLYNAYHLYGKEGTLVATASLAGDKVVSQYFGNERNYLSLSAFWGHIGYNAISQIMKLDISKNYLYLLE